MSKARPQVLSLNGGEVDREVIARSEIDSYSNKAQIYVNALPAIKGGMFRGPGTRFIGRTLEGALNEDMPAVVRPWRFSRRQAFTIEIGVGVLRLVYGVGYLQTGAGVAVFDSGWADASTLGGSSSETEPDWPDPPSPPPPPPPPDPGGDPGEPGGGGGGGGGGFFPDPP